MRRLLSTKALAARIDPTYVRAPRVLLNFRRALILICCFAVLGWWVFYLARGDQTIYTPGHVAPVHAMWEADCSKCHDPGPGGGFVRSVSDAACLKCHDGPIHHKNQATLVSLITSPPATDPAAMPVKAPPAARSSNCAHCHVEHRGHDVLLARDDAYCTQCHANVTPASKNAPRVRPDITGFSATAHPEFGRRMTPSKKWSAAPAALVDRTPIHFSHAVHMNLSKDPLPAEPLQKCTFCHEPQSGLTAGGVSIAKYTKPVNFERNCRECHPLNVPGTNVVVTHGSMSIVRAELRDLPGLEKRFLDTLPADARKALLVRPGPPPLRKPIVTTPEAWIAARVASFDSAAGSAFTSEVERTGTSGADPEQIASDPGFEGPDAKVLTLRAISMMFDSKGCVKCHEPNRSAASFLPAAASTSNPAEPATPATEPSGATDVSLATKPLNPAEPDAAPTWPANGPRRWFPGSEFDHGAHCAVNCLECHAGAMTSKVAADVSISGIQTCVRCHHPKDAGGFGVTAECRTCHRFHDRSKENLDHSFSIDSLLKSGTMRSAQTSPSP